MLEASYKADKQGNKPKGKLLSSVKQAASGAASQMVNLFSPKKKSHDSSGRESPTYIPPNLIKKTRKTNKRVVQMGYQPVNRWLVKKDSASKEDSASKQPNSPANELLSELNPLIIPSGTPAEEYQYRAPGDPVLGIPIDDFYESPSCTHQHNLTFYGSLPEITGLGFFDSAAWKLAVFKHDKLTAELAKTERQLEQLKGSKNDPDPNQFLKLYDKRAKQQKAIEVEQNQLLRQDITFERAVEVLMTEKQLEAQQQVRESSVQFLIKVNPIKERSTISYEEADDGDYIIQPASGYHLFYQREFIETIYTMSDDAWLFNHDIGYDNMTALRAMYMTIDDAVVLHDQGDKNATARLQRLAILVKTATLFASNMCQKHKSTQPRAERKALRESIEDLNQLYRHTVAAVVTVKGLTPKQGSKSAEQLLSTQSLDENGKHLWKQHLREFERHCFSEEQLRGLRELRRKLRDMPVIPEAIGYLDKKKVSEGQSITTSPRPSNL